MSKNIKDATEVVKGIVEAVPIYEDLLQPAVQELGKGLHTLSKTIHIALAPVSALIWGYDQIKLFVQSSLEIKLQNVPQDNIIPPDPSVAGPILESLRYTGHKEELRELFSNLLATAMNSETASTAHPSFVEIIKQLSPDEARILYQFNNNDVKPIVIMRAFELDNNHYAEVLNNFSLLPFIANCQYPNQGPSYLENISRFGLILLDYRAYFTKPNGYDEIENHPFVLKLSSDVKKINKRPELIRGVAQRTNFGKQFYEACIKEK